MLNRLVAFKIPLSECEDVGCVATYQLLVIVLSGMSGAAFFPSPPLDCTTGLPTQNETNCGLKEHEFTR